MVLMSLICALRETCQNSLKLNNFASVFYRRSALLGLSEFSILNFRLERVVFVNFLAFLSFLKWKLRTARPSDCLGQIENDSDGGTWHTIQMNRIVQNVLHNNINTNKWNPHIQGTITEFIKVKKRKETDSNRWSDCSI